MNEQLEAYNQAKAIEEYWISQGYDHVKASVIAKRTHGGHSVWGVKTNLVNGLPPKRKRARIVGLKVPTTYFDKLAKKICKKHKITKGDLLSGSRLSHISAAKREFSKTAYEDGKKITHIAFYLGKDHSTISHHIRSDK